ncbi:hypothetical protein ACFL6F_02610 [Planctomycetota bacterium]
MDQDKLILVERFIEGSLTEEEYYSFINEIKNDDLFTEQAAEILRMQGLLHSAADKDSLCEELTRRVDTAIGPEHEFKTFDSRVMNRIRSARRRKRSIFSSIVSFSIAACLMIAVGAYLFNLWQMSQTAKLIRARFVEVSGDVTIERNGKSIPAGAETDLLTREERQD